MKALTLRNLPPNLDRVIRQRAKQREISLNKAVISFLEEHPDLQEHKSVREYHDLDVLAGAWSKKEADAFDARLAEQRTIEPDLWKH